MVILMAYSCIRILESHILESPVEVLILSTISFSRAMVPQLVINIVL
jgi:hypothetical protein